MAAGVAEADIERFKGFMSSLTPVNVRERTQQVYAPDACLNDNLNEVHGAQAILAHFARSFDGVSDISVQCHDTVRSGDDWYVRCATAPPWSRQA